MEGECEGTASERVAGEMKRNSVQFNNCSVGYNLVEVSLTHKSDKND